VAPNEATPAPSQEIGRLMMTLGWRRFSSTLVAYTKAGTGLARRGAV
jgi:hypothetical protein